MQQIHSGSPMSEQGLQQPAVDPIMVLASLLGPGILKSLMSKEVGAGASSLVNKALTGIRQELDVMPSGIKTGDPHALFAYNDAFGPGNTERSLYNIFGDPKNSKFGQGKMGWGSSVTEDILKKNGIPITGRQAESMKYTPVR